VIDGSDDCFLGWAPTVRDLRDSRIIRIFRATSVSGSGYGSLRFSALPASRRSISLRRAASF
jgi:hypothetical protein